MKKTIVILLFAAIALTSLQIACSKSKDQDPDNTLDIGDYYQGGYIVYLFQPQDPGYSSTTPHGLIAAAVDQSTTSAWITGGSTQTTKNNNTLSAIGTGYANTNYMKGQQGFTGGAAKLCDDYSVISDGISYSDWYLPSIRELEELWRLLKRESQIAPTLESYYWSSTENSDGFVKAMKWDNIPSATIINTTKSRFYRIRAFRSF